jgi:transcriptional regulator with XRE-family HTH domain
MAHTTLKLDNSGKLFDYVMKKQNLKTDSQLAAYLGMSTPNISKIRNGINNVSPGSILTVHDTTGMSIKRIRELIAGAA